MKNTFGNNVTITIYGESHGDSIGAIIDGLPAGIKIDEEFIANQLTLRRPAGQISTSRKEADHFVIKSGVFNGYSNGNSLCVDIPNENTHSKDYSDMSHIARNGHADYTAYVKYFGYQDYRGGGHFSGRLTAALVAVGAIAISALKEKGIYIGTHIYSCADICDRPFGDYQKDIEFLNKQTFALLDPTKQELIEKHILDNKNDGDSTGAILESAIIGLPAGLGDPYFDSFESLLAHGIFSIPGVKGLEFGLGFAMAKHTGSYVNDAYRIENEKIVTATNNNGGINGGITNGMPVTFKCVIKPTPSIFKPQETVDFVKKENITYQLNGRHDPAIFHRARVVVDSVAALVVLDSLITRYGQGYFLEK